MKRICKAALENRKPHGECKNCIHGKPHIQIDEFNLNLKTWDCVLSHRENCLCMEYGLEMKMKEVLKKEKIK